MRQSFITGDIQEFKWKKRRLIRSYADQMHLGQEEESGVSKPKAASTEASATLTLIAIGVNHAGGLVRCS